MHCTDRAGGDRSEMSEPSMSTSELRDSICEVLSAESDLSLLRGEPSRRQSAMTGLWQKMASLGWFGMAIPEAFGGLGLTYRHLSVLYEELGRSLTSLPVMTTLLAADAIAMAGSDLQKQHWLNAIALGAIRASVALPTSSLALPRLGDDRMASGTVHELLYGESADELLIPFQGANETLFFGLISPASQGVEIKPRPMIDLSRTMSDVTLDRVIVERDRLFPVDQSTWTRLLDHASLAIASDAVGGAARILEDTVAYLGERRQFDRPIGSFQALKHRAASWKIEAEAITALTRHCAELIDDCDASRSAMVSAAKAAATDTYIKIAGDAVQLHGGIGFTWEHECHLFLKRARLNAVLFGGAMQHKDRAARFAFQDALRLPAAATVDANMKRFFGS
jgi:alkylation response protein AidB-like acyl-CoA dehydrogenase